MKENKMRTIFTLFLSTLCGMSFWMGGASIAQQLEPWVMEKTMMEILAENPKVDSGMLSRDQKVIEGIFPSIQTELSHKGFNEVDVKGAVMTGWKYLRSGPNELTPFSEKSFKDFVTKLGKLKIVSSPQQAHIEIDNVRSEVKTDTAVWLVTGSHLIRLTKDGYSPEEEIRNIVEGENLEFVKKLKRRSK